jgi:hypothetical protein
LATELSKDDMRRFARLGAMKRLDDIRNEEAAIRASFPELFGGDRPVRAGTTAKAAKGKAAKAGKGAKGAGGETKAVKRKRSTMSPAMRKAVSERMKKYWAGRRKTKNG